MAGNDLAMRFTEDKYATKNEVARELKITSIDTFWANIQSYRSHFYHYLSIRTIEKNMFVFCGCPALISLVNSVEMKLMRANREYGMILPTSKQFKALSNTFGRQVLTILNKVEELGVGEDFFDSVLRHEVVSAIPQNMLLVNYLKSLSYIKRAYVNNIDEDFVAALYSKLLGTEELTEFYRSNDDRNPENRILIDRVYTSAPKDLIDPMMGYLYSFIANSNLNTTLKATIAFYYINYVKPFSKYSEEMAVLIAKAILAHEGFGETVVDLPLEKLLLLPTEETARVYVEVQKTADITYFVNYVFKFIGSKCDEFLDDITNSKVAEMREDFYQADEPVQEEEPSIEEKDEKYETVDLFEASEEEESSQPAPVRNEQPIEKPVQEKEVEQPMVEQPKKKTVKVQYVQEELAVAYIPVALDEKQAILLEQDLLERDPELKKGEAKFYARHCTKGKKYTIAQYKKCLRCAYETARTAMDHLAELLYYRKEKIKNKYVYIPIERE